MIRETDPHFQLGWEHAARRYPRETGWTERELQRRYDLGYAYGTGRSVDPLMTFEELDRLMTDLGYNRER